jgi:predicted CopG family antitoxin
VGVTNTPEPRAKESTVGVNKKESLADMLRRYRREIKEKDPELYQKMLGGLTDRDIVDEIDKLDQIEQRRKNDKGDTVPTL